MVWAGHLMWLYRAVNVLMGHACYAGPFDLCNISKCESADVLFGQILVWKKYARLSETCSGKALTNVKILF